MVYKAHVCNRTHLGLYHEEIHLLFCFSKNVSEIKRVLRRFARNIDPFNLGRGSQIYT